MTSKLRLINSSAATTVGHAVIRVLRGTTAKAAQKCLREPMHQLHWGLGLLRLSAMRHAQTLHKSEDITFQDHSHKAGCKREADHSHKAEEV